MKKKLWWCSICQILWNFFLSSFLFHFLFHTFHFLFLFSLTKTHFECLFVTEISFFSFISWFMYLKFPLIFVTRFNFCSVFFVKKIFCVYSVQWNIFRKRGRAMSNVSAIFCNLFLLHTVDINVTNFFLNFSNR